MKAMKHFLLYLSCLTTWTDTAYDNIDKFVCLVYLFKHGKRVPLTRAEELEKARLATSSMSQASAINKELSALRRTVFVSNYAVGSNPWKIDVYNFVADVVASSNQLVSPREHLTMQTRRASFVLQMYWSRSAENDLSPTKRGGCSMDHGVNSDGTILLETYSQVKTVHSKIKNSVVPCRCKGNCSNRRCICFKHKLRCVACECPIIYAKIVWI